MVMYSEGELLQANAAVITGVLIFLTVSPISKGATQILERKFVLSTILITMVLLIISLGIISFSSDVEDDRAFFAARILFIVGLMGIILAIAGIMDVIPKIKRIHRDKEKT